MPLSKFGFAALLASTAFGLRAHAAPVSRDDFQLQTTANLVALCGATEDSALYTAAKNFCQGFAVGTYRAILTEQMATRSKHKLFCAPSNPPSRDQAMAAFVRWASERPQTLAESPTDGIAEYLSTQYPCS